MAKKRTSEKSAGSGMDTRKILGKILKSIRPYRLLVVLSLLILLMRQASTQTGRMLSSAKVWHRAI